MSSSAPKIYTAHSPREAAAEVNWMWVLLDFVVISAIVIALTPGMLLNVVTLTAGNTNRTDWMDAFATAGIVAGLLIVYLCVVSPNGKKRYTEVGH